MNEVSGSEPSSETAAPSDDAVASAEPLATAANQSVTYSVSPGFVEFLGRLNLSVALSSYQSGKFYLLGRNPKGGLMVFERLFSKAMGICVAGHDLFLATHFQIVRFVNVLEPGQRINHTYDACYVPRQVHTTGILDTHDLGLLASNEVVFVNTRFNCLSRLSNRHSFEPLWTPPFITRLVDEDRCHLNGLAVHDGEARYVTAVSRSDTIDGWRDRRRDGGIVVEVPSGQILCEGLSMPHSPRLHEGRLWLLNSGNGDLGWVDEKSGRFNPLVFCPGFARGLALHAGYAFVGLSKPRYQRFEGLELDQRLARADSEPWCGLQVIDLNRASCVEWFRIDGAISELYDVAVIPTVACPMALGFASDEVKTLITIAEAKHEA